MTRTVVGQKNDTRGRVLAFVYDYTAAHNGVFPSFQAIVNGLALSSKSQVYYHLQKLVEMGELEAINDKCQVGYRIAGAGYTNPPLPAWARPNGGD